MSSLNAIPVHSTVAPLPHAEFDEIKARQRATWASGDYAVVGTTLQIVGEQLCESLDLRADQRVLDVAAGNGNASLAAARRYAQVVSTDYVPSLLDAARQRAAAEGLEIEFRPADAEALPFADASFDAVLSVFGAMFTPNQRRTAAELLRVCRPGGSIGLANWTPDSFIGQMFKIIGKRLPPPSGLASPMRWGTEEFLHEHFGEDAARIETTKRSFMFRYRSAQHWLGVFRAWYGPTLKAFAALDDAGKAALAHELEELAERFNRSGDTTLVVPSEYLEARIVLKGGD